MTIEEAASKFHWFKVADDGVVEMFLDHHMLSTFRNCEAKFELDMMANIKSKHRAWPLEFGICWHKMVEEFYLHHQDQEFDIHKWLALAIEVWNTNNMQEFEEHKTCKSIGGVHGFIGMLAQYAQFFAKEVDRLRLIGIEIPFGKKREVPIGGFTVQDYGMWINAKSVYGGDNVRCFLTGRIDFLMDSGSAIGPLDHKTTASFGNKNMANEYDPQEGMTGYIYATKKIVALHFPELLVGRQVNKIWMNFAQLTPEAEFHKRFRRIPIFKTDFQLEEWRLRQLRTFHKIYDMIVLGERPDWNTSQGCKFYNYDCTYKRLHQQNSSENMLTILNADFVVGEAWDTENVNKNN
jgi:hypothetical protein